MGTSSGLGNIGIYGQQPWQKVAREKMLRERGAEGTAMGLSPLLASLRANTFLPQGSTLASGGVAGSGPSVSQGGGPLGALQNWNNMPIFTFPDTFNWLNRPDTMKSNTRMY